MPVLLDVKRISLFLLLKCEQLFANIRIYTVNGGTNDVT